MAITAKPVVLPRRQALKLARYERDSLQVRAQTSAKCTPQWTAAVDQAAAVVNFLESGSDQKAGAAATKVGPAWKRAADCEGWPTTTAPTIDNPAKPGEINYHLFDRYTIAHGCVGVGLGVMRAKWWQALLFTIGWEIIETPLKRAFPRAFPYSSEDSLANAVGDSMAVMAGWAGWKMLERAADRR
jgi:hypothetical protein